MTAEKLAIEGGPKAKKTPFGTGMRFGDGELALLKEALAQNTLFYYKGQKVKAFTEKFAQMHGFKHCVATNSGTASIHTALSALGITLGDEVIVTSLTDMGSVIGILFQNAIPVFADIHPRNFNIDPACVEKAVTNRTKAIIAVHLFGGSCDIDALLAISRKHRIPLIEDCAQAFGAKYRGKPVGSFGAFGCFSTNDFKHLSTGDGGLVVTSDDRLAKLAFEVADKNYCRTGASPFDRSPKFLAPNYRMTELQGAVGLAQLSKLDGICKRRNELGQKLCGLLQGIPGVVPYEEPANGFCSFLHFSGRLDLGALRVDRKTFLDALNAEGVAATQYIPEPVYRYPLFRTRTIYQNTHFPLEGTGKSYTYEKGLCPVTEEVIDTIFMLPHSEFFTDRDIEETAIAFRKVAEAYAK